MKKLKTLSVNSKLYVRPHMRIYDRTFRFNGGGYMYGSNPYIDYDFAMFFTIRKYL